MLIGNDVVDLTDSAARGKAADARFIHRVFTSVEADRIATSRDPNLALWMLWAAKEAAYKIAAKVEPGMPFRPRRIEVAFAPAASVVPGARADANVDGEWGWTGDGSSDRPGEAIVGGGIVRLPGSSDVVVEIQLQWTVSTSFVHCVATTGTEDSGGSLRVAVGAYDFAGSGSGDPAGLTSREASRLRSAESVAVRRLAKRLARESSIDDLEIVRKAGGPPRLYSLGGEAPLEGYDISLSHDGAYVAAAVWCPEASPVTLGGEADPG